MNLRDATELALPDGYRLGWKFCFLPTIYRGQTVWLCSIPILQRRHETKAMGVCWGREWVTVGLLDDPEAVKPSPIRDF